MSEDKKFEELKEELEIWFEEILSITKALGNKTRLKVLSLLLHNNQSFQALMNYSKLKKTALSNHLNKLVINGVIRRVDYGIYEITSDGKLFIQAIIEAYNQSDHKKQQLKTLEGVKMSSLFIHSLFKRK